MSYAPASPDLSSFYSGSAAPTPPSTTSKSSNPPPPTTSSTRPLPLNPPSGLPVSPTSTTRQPPIYQVQSGGQQFSTQQHLQQPSYYAPAHPHSHAFQPPAHSPYYQTHQPYGAQQHPASHQQLLAQPPLSGLPSGLTAQAPPPPAHQQFYQQYGDQQNPHHYKIEPDAQPYQLAQVAAPPGAFDQLPPHPRGAQVKQEFKTEDIWQGTYQDNNMPPRRSAVAAPPAQPAILPSPVRTKFPTARIKRIMQADEEVGKVAQQTPIAVGKALELFMVALVSKSHDVAAEKGAKRVTAQHLKQVIESDDQWDFLREIVGRVSETDDRAGKSGGRAKAESEESEEETSAVEVKKKGRGGRKKKNA